MRYHTVTPLLNYSLKHLLFNPTYEAISLLSATLITFSLSLVSIYKDIRVVSMYHCIMEENNGNNGVRKRKVQEHQESIEEEEEEEEKKMEEFYALIRSTREMREYLMRRSQDNPSTLPNPYPHPHPHHQHHLINHHYQEHKVSTSFNGWSFQPEDFIAYSSAKGHAGTSIAVEKQGQRPEEREDDEEKKEKKEDEDGGMNNSSLDLNLSL